MPNTSSKGLRPFKLGLQKVLYLYMASGKYLGQYWPSPVKCLVEMVAKASFHIPLAMIGGCMVPLSLFWSLIS